VKRIRGVAFTERVSPQAANRMVDAARGVLNPLLPDVYIFTDHRSGKAAGASPGFGLSLVAETTTGCALGADGVAARGSGEGGAGEPDTPDEVGVRVAEALLAEIAASGAVDGSHQALALFLCAVGPDALASVTLGRLAPSAVRLLRDLRDFLGVTFNLEPRAEDGTVVASCVGLGIGNVARPVT
jgi:RNA 3'-terminal phosphate cyclase-like protein